MIELVYDVAPGRVRRIRSGADVSSRLRKLLTPADPTMIGWPPGEVLWSEPDVRAKATEVIELVPYRKPAALPPYEERPPRGLLAVFVDGDHVSFEVMSYAAGPGTGTDGMPVLWEPVFSGEGPSGALRELRHTDWGSDGYLADPPADVIGAAFRELRRWFDLPVIRG